MLQTPTGSWSTVLGGKLALRRMGSYQHERLDQISCGLSLPHQYFRYTHWNQARDICRRAQHHLGDPNAIRKQHFGRQWPGLISSEHPWFLFRIPTTVLLPPGQQGATSFSGQGTGISWSFPLVPTSCIRDRYELSVSQLHSSTLNTAPFVDGICFSKNMAEDPSNDLSRTSLLCRLS